MTSPMSEFSIVLDMSRSCTISRFRIRAVDPTLTIEITGLRPVAKTHKELGHKPGEVDPGVTTRMDQGHASKFAA
jgi:hypothetical protein